MGGGSDQNPTANVSLSDTHTCDVNCLMEKERLPDLCPVNCDHKTCYAFGLKTKSLDEERTNEENSNENENRVAVSLWESFATLYVPFLLQALCGGVHIIRSIFVTYILQTLLQSESWADSKLCRTIMSFSPEGSSLPSWPPPSLVFLAALTLTALIIHPDGFTWIALRKLRGSFLYLFESSSTCWAWVLNDFGSVVSTILAMTTFACLFFFCYLLHRTLRPRSNKNTEASSSKGTCASSLPAPEKSRRKRRKGKNDKQRAAKQTTIPQTQIPSSTQVSPSPQPPLSVEAATEISVSAISPVDAAASSFSSSCAADKESLLSVPEKAESKETQDKNQMLDLPRLRGESQSTVDTAMMDTSFEEASVGSAISGRSTPIQPTATDNTRNASGRSSCGRKTRGAQTPRTANTATTTRNRRSEHSAKAKNAVPVVVSRWDALKPAATSSSNDEMLDGTTTTKGIRKNPKGAHPRAPRNTKQTHCTTTMTPQISAPPKVESPSRTHAPRSSVPPPAIVDSLWLSNDASVVPSSNCTAFMTSFLEENNNRGRSSPATASSTGSTLNPRSPPFAPSQAVGLRPPPGLTPAPPGFGTNTTTSIRMEPVLLPPATSSPALSSSSSSPVPGLTLPSGCTNSPNFLRPRENPFVDDDDEEQIAAELQELGGQMVGSILDF